jgi:hypothetical protein
MRKQYMYLDLLVIASRIQVVSSSSALRSSHSVCGEDESNLVGRLDFSLSRSVSNTSVCFNVKTIE